MIAEQSADEHEAFRMPVQCAQHHLATAVKTRHRRCKATAESQGRTVARGPCACSTRKCAPNTSSALRGAGAATRKPYAGIVAEGGRMTAHRCSM